MQAKYPVGLVPAGRVRLERDGAVEFVHYTGFGTDAAAAAPGPH